MIEQVFLCLIGLSVSASVMIVIMIGLRVVLRNKRTLIKQSAFVVVGLLILLRACLPLHGEWLWWKGQITPAQTIYHTVFGAVLPGVASGEHAGLALDGKVLPDSTGMSFAPDSNQAVQLMEAVPVVDAVEPERAHWFHYLAWCWAIGMGVLLAITLLAYERAQRRVKQLPDLEKLMPQFIPLVTSVRKRHGLKRQISIKLSRDGASAVYGLFKPVVVLDKDSLTQAEFLLTHEFIHIQRHDNLKKLFSRCCLCVHWFNPLVWLAVGQLQRDIETACDEKVLMVLGYQERKSYAAAILELAERRCHRRMSTFTSFGRHPVSQRIKHVLYTSERAKSFPVVAMAVVLFFLTGCLSSPVAALEEGLNTADPAPFYSLQGDFLDISRPYPNTHDLLDYAVATDKVYFVVADRSGRSGDRLVIKDRQNTVLFDQEITAADSKVVSTILLLGDRLYYFLQDDDGLTCLYEWRPNTEPSRSIYALPDLKNENEADIILCGEGNYLIWYEGSELIVFDCQQVKVVERIKTNGHERYSIMMDGFVAYQYTEQATGEVMVSRYQPASGVAPLAIRSLLGDETYSVYASQYYMVYKESFKNGADIIVYDVAQGRGQSLWVMLRVSMTEEEIEDYRDGKWGVNLIQDKLILTGVGNKLCLVDLQQGTLQEISGEASGIGFYQPKNSASSFSVLQYGATGKSVYETGSIYFAQVARALNS